MVLIIISGTIYLTISLKGFTWIDGFITEATTYYLTGGYEIIGGLLLIGSLLIMIVGVVYGIRQLSLPLLAVRR